MKTSRELNLIAFLLWLFLFCPIINANIYPKSNDKAEIQGANQNIYTGRWKLAYLGHVNHRDSCICIKSISGAQRDQITVYRSGLVEISTYEPIRIRKILAKDTKTNVIMNISFVTKDELRSGAPNSRFFIKNKNDISKLIELLDNGESIILSMSNETTNYQFQYGQTKYLKSAIRTYFNMSTEEMNKLFMLSSTNDNKIVSQKINIGEKQDEYNADLANRRAFFPGDEKELKRFLISKMQYPSPDIMLEKNGTVSVAFVINEDGYVNPESVTVIKSLNKYLDFTSKQVVAKYMPKWEPAVKDGHFVSQKDTLSFYFKLD